MKKNLKTQIIKQVATCLLAFSAIHSEGASTFYQFRGTVTDSDSSLAFISDLNVAPGLEVKIGDAVTGMVEIKSRSDAPGFPNGSFGPGRGAYFYLNTTQHLTINGRQLSNGEAPTIAVVADNVSRGNSIDFVTSPLSAEFGDSFAIHVSSQDTRGVLLDGEPIPSTSYVDILLNLTDSTGTVFQNTGHPIHLDGEKFDMRKGFIIRASGSGGVIRNRGIIFTIDTLEEFDPSAPIIELATPVEITTGFHVSWPANAEGYVLEESESVGGGWVRYEKTPLLVEGQNIVVMDMQSRAKIFRLTKTN